MSEEQQKSKFQGFKEWLKKLFSSDSSVSYNKVLGVFVFLLLAYLANVRYYEELVVVAGVLVSVIGLKNGKEYFTDRITIKNTKSNGDNNI